MLKHFRRTLSLLTVAAAVGLVSAGLALGKKGGGKPPKDPPPPPPITYSILFLGTLPGDASSIALNVNDLGEVVGSSFTGSPYRAFLWTESDGMKALNDLMSEEDKLQWDLTSARGINNAGQICGRGYLNGDRRAYRFTYRNENGPVVPAVVENLGTLGGDWSSAHAINNQGDVAGESTDENGTERAFVYTDVDGDGTEEMEDIGDLGGDRAQARGINDSGQVTGTSHILLDNGATSTQPFRYTPGVGMENLGDFGTGGTISGGFDINDAGHVVGVAGNAPKKKGWPGRHAFLYTDHMIDLGTLGGWFSEARGVNSSDDVVGRSHVDTKDDTDAGFLYIEEFGMLKLEDLIPGFQGPIKPEKINDAGQICGRADGEAFLLTPVEP